MIVATRALLAGLRTVLLAPHLLLVVSLLTLATALPFGVWLADRLQTALSNQPPIALEAEEIDAEWWMEFRAQAQGLEATFTPTVIGFAAPLDNLSALLDGDRRPLILLAPVASYSLLWAVLWGGLLSRFAANRAIGTRAFVQASSRHIFRFALISVAVFVFSWMLYLTLHPVLFGPVFSALARQAGSERTAFLWRVGLYLVFLVPLAFASLIADYTRIHSVTTRTLSLKEAVRTSVRFIRGHLSSVVALHAMTAALFVALFVLYGFADRRLGGWRGVLLGQAFIFGRLAIRLTVAGSQIALVQEAGGREQGAEAGISGRDA